MQYDEPMTWSIALGVGAGALSSFHCAAMCGPLVAAQAARGRGVVLRYQLGRVTSYGLLGAAAGASGHAVDAIGGPVAGALFSWGLAAGLLLAATRLWRRARAPESEAVPLRRRRVPLIARAVAAVRPGPLGLGALSALLPCGSLWLATGLAASTGGMMAGFATMLGFAGASAAALLTAAWLGGRLGRRSLATRRVLAAIAVLGAVVTALRPITATASSASELPPCHRLIPGARP